MSTDASHMLRGQPGNPGQFAGSIKSEGTADLGPSTGPEPDHVAAADAVAASLRCSWDNDVMYGNFGSVDNTLAEMGYTWRGVDDETPCPECGDEDCRASRGYRDCDTEMYYVNPDPLPDRATDPAGHAAEVMKRVCSVLETDEYNADTTDALAEIMRGAGYDIDRPERDYSNEDWKAELEAGDEIRVGDESWTLVTGPIECDDEDDDHFGELAFVAQHSVTLETEQFWASEIS